MIIYDYICIHIYVYTYNIIIDHLQTPEFSIKDCRLPGYRNPVFSTWSVASRSRPLFRPPRGFPCESAACPVKRSAVSISWLDLYQMLWLFDGKHKDINQHFLTLLMKTMGRFSHILWPFWLDIDDKSGILGYASDASKNWRILEDTQKKHDKTGPF